MTNRASDPIHAASIAATGKGTAPTDLLRISSAASQAERIMPNTWWNTRVSAWPARRRLCLPTGRLPARRRRQLRPGRLAGLRHQHTDCGPPICLAWCAIRASTKEAAPAGTGIGPAEPVSGSYLLSVRPPMRGKAPV